MYELIYSLRVKYGFAEPPCMRTVANKAQVSFLTNRFINMLTYYLRKVEKFAFAGAIFQRVVTRARGML